LLKHSLRPSHLVAGSSQLSPAGSRWIARREGTHVLMGRDLDCPQFRIQSGFEVGGGNLLTAGGTPPSLFLSCCLPHGKSWLRRVRSNPVGGPILLCEHFPALCVGIAHVGCPKVRAGCPISQRAFSPRGLRAHPHERRPLRGLFLADAKRRFILSLHSMLLDFFLLLLHSMPQSPHPAVGHRRHRDTRGFPAGLERTV